MAAPEGLVFRGMEGTGAAQIFGREGNPMRAYLQRKEDIGRKRAIQAEQAKLAKAARDKKMFEMVSVDPERAFQPFNQQVLDAADTHRSKIARYFEEGGNPDDLDFIRKAKKGWDEVNDLARRSNYIKETIDKTQQVIKENPYLRQDYYFPKIWDVYMDENGNGKPLDQVDPVEIQNIYMNDPMGFNSMKYEKDFMDGLNENMASYINQKVTNNGILTEDTEIKWKGNLYTPDPDSPIGVAVDDRGEPIVNVTPQLVNSFTNSDNAKRFYEAIAKDQGKDVRDIVADRIRDRGGLKQDIKPSFSREPNWMFDYFNASAHGLKPNQIQQATNRAKKIENIINAVSNDGAISPSAQAAVGALRNSKMGDGHVLDVKIIPANNTPGTTEVFDGSVVTNSPNPRLILKVKYSDRGLPKTEEINLADEGAFESLNGLFEQSPSEGKQTFSTDQLTSLMKYDLGKLYRGQRGVAERNEAEKQVENNTVQAWQKGEGMETLAGRYYNGKKIISARRIVEDPGVLGIGKKYAIELEFKSSDGLNKEYENIPADKYDEFGKIYRGEGAMTVDDTMVAVISPDGIRGKIPKENLDAAIKAGYKKAN